RSSDLVRGDAVAGIIITLINIIGGLVIGVIDAGMPVGEAAALFTRLTIGDGLVTQVPALLISLAAGLLVTRTSTESDLPAEFLTQLFSRPKALAVTGGFAALLIFTNLPTVPLLGLAGGCIGLAVLLSRRERAAETAASAEAQARENPPGGKKA